MIRAINLLSVCNEFTTLYTQINTSELQIYTNVKFTRFSHMS